ncbi:hypothetical protein GUJ93_ZPchr0012g21603 [Zizania palustris]|uniref:Uncharacterized protein n=1 Tax=Zizania palustris TaxID=103762 RepID=A0A8J5WPW5_ZIZPA|nr:hypothetical protein GUJ93_ZPchr0012g21603 [Zizania palustris]
MHRKLTKLLEQEEQEPRTGADTAPGIKKGIHPQFSMAAKYIAAGIVGSFAISYACDHLISDKKIFGGTTPNTVSNKEWISSPKIVIEEAHMLKLVPD